MKKNVIGVVMAIILAVGMIYGGIQIKRIVDLQEAETAMVLHNSGDHSMCKMEYTYSSDGIRN